MPASLSLQLMQTSLHHMHQLTFTLTMQLMQVSFHYMHQLTLTLIVTGHERSECCGRRRSDGRGLCRSCGCCRSGGPSHPTRFSLRCAHAEYCPPADSVSTERVCQLMLHMVKSSAYLQARAQWNTRPAGPADRRAQLRCDSLLWHMQSCANSRWPSCQWSGLPFT